MEISNFTGKQTNKLTSVVFVTLIMTPDPSDGFYCVFNEGFQEMAATIYCYY